jgi:TRAPP trafficking subunit Trs65
VSCCFIFVISNNYRPLGPSVCFSAQLVFLPLIVGTLHLEALRLIDLATQLSVDIKELPDIVVER